MNGSSVVAGGGSVNAKRASSPFDATAGPASLHGVEILWTLRAFPVDGLSAKIFSEALRTETPAPPCLCTGFREALRLIARARCIQFPPLSLPTTPLPKPVTDDVHRFQESIAGRSYLIEVTPVSRDRWRAYIVRIPGVPTALMPFYGSTPADAARQLCDWLTRAYARAAAPSSGTV